MLIVRHLGTSNSDFNECHCMRGPVLHRSMNGVSCRVNALGLGCIEAIVGISERIVVYPK